MGNVTVHKELEQKKKRMAQRMGHKTFDSGRTSVKDKHGFIKNNSGHTAMQSFHYAK